MKAVRILGSLVFGVAVALPVSLALAADAPSAPYIPEKYLISRGPAEFGMAAPAPEAVPAQSQIERPQYVDGTTYTVITPIFTGADGNNSFLRFPNYTDGILTNLISVVGATSGTLYGTATVAPQPHASPQVTIASILALANVTATTNTTSEAVTLYVRNPSPTAAYQHIIFNGNSNFFENMSVCTLLSTTANGTPRTYRYLSTGVFNVHTTQLSTFPSYVTIHNYTNTGIIMNLDVYEAATGDLKGTYVASALPNATYALPFSQIQDNIGWSPTTTELHANVLLRATSGVYPNLAIGQYIYNAGLKTYVNMSTVCPINFGN